MNMLGQSSPPRRRHLRLQGFDYRQTGAYFITVCAFRRAGIFGKIISGKMQINDWGQIVMHCWQQIPDHFCHTNLDAFVVMPNHIHGILHITNFPVGARPASPLQIQLHQPTNPAGLRYASPACRHPSLGHLVASLKSASTKQIRELSGQPGVTVWQRGYYEHVIRNDESLTRIREYILHNPLSWHLDRENDQATGHDDFDLWLDNQKTVPIKKNTP
mgnify:CR=1 FL=1